MVFKINRGEWSTPKDYLKSGRRCATDVPNALVIDRVRGEVAALRRAIRAKPETVAINIQFIHITDGNQGTVNEDQRKEQIDVLNKAYSKSGFTFRYEPSSVKTIDRPAWFNMGYRSAAERDSKEALQVPPEYSLNLYTANLQRGLLGWATFPWDLAGDRIRDGVVILWSTLPGGDAGPFNLGQTCTHEIGHWLGLYHTFQGGCNGIGDEVDDTPAHEEETSGCPGSGMGGACSQGDEVPIHNYMNYSDDICLSEFTSGQIERMKDMAQTYRSTLLIGPDAPLLAGRSSSTS
jgi:hypothetical protein